MIKRVMLVGVGAAVGWLGHTVFSKGRDAAAVRAEETIRNTLNPENIGRNAGQAAATALAASARSFASQLREEVPAWKTISSSLADPAPRSSGAPSSGEDQDPAHTTIQGTATSATPPTDPRKQS
ncbi:hypothetical protein [Citricoccus sp. I39-566]|uniref:hypothetical protein n=1 Tax=Citricoccus sp. I39-566 TaxID=3073268 RepID=UPI00286BA2F3|nr:hypothetical protein [Citricoccus sp. I39-566]WMY77508.1 hypothetical protein RE421_11735 [Citricoccus sp. I39-566]